MSPEDWDDMSSVFEAGAVEALDWCKLGVDPAFIMKDVLATMARRAKTIAHERRQPPATPPILCSACKMSKPGPGVLTRSKTTGNVKRVCTDCDKQQNPS